MQASNLQTRKQAIPSQACKPAPQTRQATSLILTYHLPTNLQANPLTTTYHFPAIHPFHIFL